MDACLSPKTSSFFLVGGLQVAKSVAVGKKGAGCAQLHVGNGSGSGRGVGEGVSVGVCLAA